MKKIIIVFISLFLLFLTSCGTQDDKKITTKFLSGSYHEKTHELNLSSDELTQVPNFEKYLTGSYKDDIWSINLMNNNIKEIDGKLFEYFPNLRELNLSYNKIEKINLRHNFIKVLELHKNNLNKVDLIGVKGLTDVNIGYNNILSLNDVLLPKNIKSLELQHNKLSDLNGIENLLNIEKLKLEFNNLEDNDLQGLKLLKKLDFISIGKNKLSKKLEESFKKINEK